MCPWAQFFQLLWMHLNHPEIIPLPSPWTNCLPQNQSQKCWGLLLYSITIRIHLTELTTTVKTGYTLNLFFFYFSITAWSFLYRVPTSIQIRIQNVFQGELIRFWWKKIQKENSILLLFISNKIRFSGCYFSPVLHALSLFTDNEKFGNFFPKFKIKNSSYKGKISINKLIC